MPILCLTQKEYELLHNERAIFQRNFTYQGNYRHIEIYPTDLRIIDAIARVLIQHYETKYLRKILMKEFYFTLEHEIESIIKYAQFLLNYGDIFEDLDHNEINENRLNEIRNALYDYLTEAESLHLQGFFQFRLKKVWNEYGKIVENAIDEYMMEKEYRDYINYLRGLVRDRPMQLPFLHVLHQQDQYLLFDNLGNEIAYDQLDALVTGNSDIEIIYDDQMITKLIAINPTYIHLHCHNSSHHLEISLKNIFEERLTICTGCSMCKGWLENRG